MISIQSSHEFKESFVFFNPLISPTWYLTYNPLLVSFSFFSLLNFQNISLAN